MDTLDISWSLEGYVERTRDVLQYSKDFSERLDSGGCASILPDFNVKDVLLLVKNSRSSSPKWGRW